MCCLQINPLDVVLFNHGMLHAAYSNTYCASVNCNNRYMLFLRCVLGVGNQFLHRLTAADKLTAAVLNKADDITANTAFQKFYCHCASLLSQNKTFIDLETQCP